VERGFGLSAACLGNAGATSHIDLHQRRHTAAEDRGFTDVVRRRGPLVVLGVVVSIAVLSGIGALVLAVESIDHWDLDVVRWIADRRTERGDTLTEWGTYLAETVPIAALTFLTMLVAWLRWRRWAAPLFVAAAVGGEKLIYLLTSIIVGRDRPPIETLGDTYATRSFPSGHIASAITLYGSIALLLGLVAARHWRTVAFVVVAVIAAIVGVCRTYRGFHYLTDVLACALLGIVWLAFVWHVMRPELADDQPNTDGSSPDTLGRSAHGHERATSIGSPGPR
jgi:membrane-associated phospholipid phosphatase